MLDKETKIDIFVLSTHQVPFEYIEVTVLVP